ncbi:MAG: hypothetical protein ABIN61_08025 [candidate division WOR-3 bacterium]
MKENINELKEKIISNARKEAEIILQRAEKVRERILTQAREEEKKVKEEAEKKGKSLFEKGKEKFFFRKKINERKGILFLRKQLFEMLQNDLIEKLTSMFKEGKLNSWIRISCERIAKEEGEIVLVAKEEELDRFKNICDGIKGLSFSPRSIIGGFLIIGKESEYDFRFSTIANKIIKQNMRKIADKLGVRSG